MARVVQQFHQAGFNGRFDFLYGIPFTAGNHDATRYFRAHRAERAVFIFFKERCHCDVCRYGTFQQFFHLLLEPQHRQIDQAHLTHHNRSDALIK